MCRNSDLQTSAGPGPFTKLHTCPQTCSADILICQQLDLTAWAHMFRGYENPEKNHKPKYFISFEMYFIPFSKLFYFF